MGSNARTGNVEPGMPGAELLPESLMAKEYIEND